MTDSAVIFDLDGTLLDTLADIAESANRALSAEGFAGHPIDDYRGFVGNGVSMLMQRALPEDHRHPETIARCAEQFRTVYRENWNVRTKPYAGIRDVVRQLVERRWKLGVLSNKPHEFTVKCVDEFFDGEFQSVLGQRDGVLPKPDPSGVFEIVQQLAVPLDRCLFVGDSSVDMETARNAGTTAVGVTWGFRSRQELLDHGAQIVCDTPAQLLPLLISRLA